MFYFAFTMLAFLNNVQKELLYYPRCRRWRQHLRLRQRPQMLKVYVKVFRTSVFPNPLMDFVHVCYDDRYWSKLLCSTIPTPQHDLKVKVTDFMLKFCVKVFTMSLFPTLVMYLVQVWCGDRYWSKIYLVPSPSHTWPLGQGHILKNFYVNVLC